MHKLSFLVLLDNILRCLHHYLNRRYQKVVVNVIESTIKSVCSGVPHGSLLGPLLLLIFIYDIGRGIKSKIRLYADDCVVYRETNDHSDKIALQDDLDKMYSLCCTWRILLNFTKCQHIRFSQKRVPLPAEYRLNNVLIPQTTEVKYLGVIFSSDLTWNRHIEAVSFKAASTLNFIRRNFRNAPQAVKERLYLSNIRPILEYACAICDPHTKYLIDSLEFVQNCATRFVTQNKELAWPA